MPPGAFARLDGSEGAWARSWEPTAPSGAFARIKIANAPGLGPPFPDKLNLTSTALTQEGGKLAIDYAKVYQNSIPDGIVAKHGLSSEHVGDIVAGDLSLVPPQPL